MLHLKHMNGSVAPEQEPQVAAEHSNAEVTEDEYSEPAQLRSKKSILKNSGLERGLASEENGRVKRAVSWHDFQGKHLHTVREFVPSEHDDEEPIEEQQKKGGCCVIC